jgi:hypothetical protein
MREIIFDTETTGLNPAGGDRMVEIGCIEIVNRVETGRTFHAYFNPERPMPSEAEAVHACPTSSCPTSRDSPTRSKSCSSSSAIRRWSRTMPRLTSASSTMNCSAAHAIPFA